MKDFVVTELPSEELKNAVKGSGRFVIPKGIKTEQDRNVSLKAKGDTLTIDRLEIGDSVAFDYQVDLKEKEIPKLEELDNVVQVTGTYETPKKDTGQVEKDADDQDNDKINIANPLASVSKLADKTTGVTLKHGRYEGEKVSGWYDFASEVSYRILIQNNGNVPISQLHLAESLSKELGDAVEKVIGYRQDLGTLKSSAGKDLKVTPDEEGFGFTIEELERGDSVAVDLVVKLKERDVPKLEELENQVFITGKYRLTGEDPKGIPEDEDDSDWDKINIADPKLSIIKLADRTTGVTVKDGTYEGEKKAGVYYGGEQVTYQIQVKNQGNVPAKELLVTDTMGKELQRAAEEPGCFELPEDLKTIKGKDAKVTLEGEHQLRIQELDAEDGILLPFTVTLKKAV